MTFKYIRNRISEYSKNSLLIIAFRVLKIIEQNPVDNYPIFSLLTLIKWTALYGGNKYPTKEADLKSFDRLMSQISELETLSQFLNLNKSQNYIKLLTVAAHQQFWLQDELNMSVIWRQLVLYALIETKYDVKSSFKTKTGIELMDFFKIAFIIYVHIHPEKTGNKFDYDGTISTDWFHTIDTATSSDARLNFLRLLSFGTKESIDRLKRDSEKIKNFQLRPFDTDFFGQYPFFYFNKEYYLLHRALLPTTIRHYVYDFLKENDNRFSDDFGKRMEKYIGMGIKEMGLDFSSESNFRSKHPDCRYQVDFIVSDNILIESKAIELSTLSSVFPENRILYNSLRDSVVKAYVKQMLSVANYLNSNIEYFGIIITYKKLYLGSGLDCWDSFLKENTHSFCEEKNLKYNILPPDNLFFIDLDTWDIIVQIVVNKKARLLDLLKYFKSQDQNSETKKFEIKMHLRDYFPIDVNLSFHKEAESIFKF